MEEFELNKEYLFSKIEKIVLDSNNLSMIELGESFRIGMNFIIVTNESNNSIASFILIGYNNYYGGIYKCIYKD